MDQVIAINNLRDEKDATLSDITHNKLLPICHHPTDQVIAINNLREHKHRHPKGVRNLQRGTYNLKYIECMALNIAGKFLSTNLKEANNFSHKEHT